MRSTTKLRTPLIESNENISFPIGTILTVQSYYERLGLSEIFGKHKGRGRNINSLLEALLSYKLTENQSVTKAADWINREEVLNTVEYKKSGGKRHIFSNFNPISRVILGKNQAIT